MIRKGIVPYAFFLVILLLILPVQAHVPLSDNGNNTLEGAVVVDNPEKTYVFYGNLHEPGEVAYYRFEMHSGDLLAISLMNSGKNSPVPDMIIFSPELAGQSGEIPAGVTIPDGFGVEIIRGQHLLVAEYEPFGPAAIFPVANYSHHVTNPGTYYVAIVSRTGDTPYSIATGDREEFSPAEWVTVPIGVIRTHLWEGQDIISLLAPFLAVTILGALLIVRREGKKGMHHQPAFWFAIIAGLCYLGGAAVTLVQMVRALAITGFSSGIVITLIFALIPVILSIIALRLTRTPEPWPVKVRISFGVIAVLGIIFWSGILIGPALTLIAAIIPDRTKAIPKNP
jgi:hypothetical protein